MTDIDSNLKLSCLRALWTHVTPCLRSVSVELINNDIHFQAIFDKEASEDDLDLLSQAAGEVIADYNEFGLKEIIKVVPFPDKVEPLKNLVYYRHEHNYFRE